MSPYEKNKNKCGIIYKRISGSDVTHVKPVVDTRDPLVDYPVGSLTGTSNITIDIDSGMVFSQYAYIGSASNTGK